MKLHQINATYDPIADRLLIRISTQEQTEFQLWFTRRLVRRLWPSLFKMLQSHEAISTQANDEAKRALLEMRHEQAMQEVSFGSGFGTDLTPALEGGPLLIKTVEMTRSDAQHFLMKFLPAEGEGLQVQFQEAIVHGLAKLMAEALKKSDWSLDLRLPGASAAIAEPAATVAAGRTLN